MQAAQLQRGPHMMKIVVVDCAGKGAKVFVPSHCTVANLHARLDGARLQGSFEWPGDEGRLVFQSNMHLRPNWLLTDYGVSDGCVLFAVKIGRNLRQFAVNCSWPQQMITHVDVDIGSCCVHPGESVGSLRELMGGRLKVPLFTFDLLAGDKLLHPSEDGKLLKNVLNIAHPALRVREKVLAVAGPGLQPAACKRKVEEGSGDDN
eukprot:2784-Heterococcus_DN1.PRE.3